MLDRPALLAHIAQSLHLPTLRLRCQSADLLSALCVLSPYEGHGLVLAALSDLHQDSEEQFRFQWLISSFETAYGFGLSDEESDTSPEGLWEWRAAAMGLLNAIANTPDNLETRCELRGGLDRRGLTSTLEVRCVNQRIAIKKAHL